VVAVAGGEVVGARVVRDHPTAYVAAAAEAERFVHLLVTSRALRGHGLGTVLLDRARALTRGAGVDLLRVDCFGGGTGELVRWYCTQGLQPTERLDVKGWPCQVLAERVLSRPGARFDELRTERLLLRHWAEADREPFAVLNSDPEVMRYFPAPLDRAASDAFVDRLEQSMTERGWGLWALERLDTGELIGFTGLHPAVDLPPSPAVEVGWRLASAHWGQGFAPEAARAALAVAFAGLGLDEVVSFTTTGNAPSRRVMRKLGLTHRPARDFDHPRTPGWAGQRHVLYAIDRAQWAGRSARDAGDR
jgi:RimJ/RimL family protein N-acetyltransferase